MSYETNDKVIFKYKGEFQVGVITGKSNLKDKYIYEIIFFIKSLIGSN